MVWAQSLDEARAFHRAGQWREAVEAYRGVIAGVGVGDEETLGIAHNNLCVALTEMASLAPALEACERALEIRRGMGDLRRVARSLNNQGRVLQRLGRFSEALEVFREALALNEGRGDLGAQAVNRSNLGTAAFEMGDYAMAIRFFESVARLAKENPQEAWAPTQEAIAQLNYGVVLEKLGAYREALDLYEGLLNEVGVLSMAERATLQVNRGVLYRNLGDPRAALMAFEEAIRTFEGLGDPIGLSNAWLNRGLAFHLNLGDFPTAETSYREALAYALEGEAQAEEVQDLVFLGRLLQEQGRLEEAEEVLSMALRKAEEGAFLEAHWSALEGLGRLAESRGDLEAAAESLEQAIEIIEGVRADLRPGMRRAGYFGDKQQVYAAAVRVRLALDTKETEGARGHRALALVQQAKARGLSDALGTVGLGGFETRNLDQSFEGGTVLEYFVGERDLFLWVIEEESLQTLNLGPAEPWMARVTQVHRALAAGEEPEVTALQQLSETLLGSVDLAQESPRPLWIAPHRQLQYLPFEILPLPGGELLVEKRPVAYLPSASAFRDRSEVSGSPQRLFLGFGNPRLPASPSNFSDPAALVAARFDLGPLPGTVRELETSAKLLGGDTVLFLDERATEDALRQEVSAGSRVLHLATHSLMDDRPGRGAAIVLSPSMGEDGLLTPEEIARMDFQVDLTVLAACRTALSRSESSHALTTLVGSFLAAGSKAVVASLWDVGDRATEALMEQFYFYLSRGLEPAEALQQAKKRLRGTEGWESPALWSGFVLIGHGAPVVQPRRGLWGLGILVLAGLLMAWHRTRR